MEVNGTLVWYYCICKREVWLMSRGIVPDQQDSNIDMGRFIHENSYSRNKKEISFGHVKFDIMYQSQNELVIGETKKSSKFQEASKWQLLYYLNVLRESGIDAKGVLLYPEERKRIEVTLGEAELSRLQEILSEIESIISMEKPFEIEENNFCDNCGYREYCYA